MSGPKICYVIVSGMNYPYGTEMHTALMIDQFVKNGFRTVLYAVRYFGEKSAWHTFLRERGVVVKNAGFWLMNRRNWPQRVIAWRMLRDARREKPILIWAPENDTAICIALQNNGGVYPFVVHDSNECSSAFPFYPKSWFEVCNMVSGLSVHGKRQHQSALSYYKMTKPVAVVWPSSFHPRKTGPIPGNRPIRFGQFGRLYDVKGSIFAVAAFAQCLARGAAAELHFFGEGPAQGATEELGRSLGVQDKVFFHGGYTWQQLDRLIELIDVGLMPSIYEGFGLVMLELMSRGRPVISSDVGSSREVLEELGGGWVVQRADTSSLSDTMTLCATDPEIVRTKGVEARKVWLDCFTPENMFNRYMSFFSECGIDMKRGRVFK